MPLLSCLEHLSPVQEVVIVDNSAAEIRLGTHNTT